MNCYIITYDLNNFESVDYQTLYKEIKSYGTWAHINESVWAVVTSKSAKDVRDHLKTVIDQNDSLFVVKSGTEAAWFNVRCTNEWLKDNL